MSIISDSFDVIIVGAGPAGVGVANALLERGVTNLCILEASEIGHSFIAWPKQMRFITPSFNANPFGSFDLNSVTRDSSPAHVLEVEHPSGLEYASYLNSIVESKKILTKSGAEVLELRYHVGDKTTENFTLETSIGQHRCKYVVWAAGEFANPEGAEVKASESCVHSSKVADWDLMEGSTFAIIGAGESGVDASINLIGRGKDVHLFSRHSYLHKSAPDPSEELSPYTKFRLKAALQSASSGQLFFHPETPILEIVENDDGWLLLDNSGETHFFEPRPILATGFNPNLRVVSQHFLMLVNGRPLLTTAGDESTLTPGVFYCGPAYDREGEKYCFIYKFRTRFEPIAEKIKSRLAEQ